MINKWFDAKIGIVGAGAMGTGIAQVAVTNGMSVYMFDNRNGAAASSCGEISERLRKRVSEGKLSSDDASSANSRLHAVDKIGQLSDCALIVEAIVENLSIKRSLFVELENVAAADTILVSNTSSLPIGAIAVVLKAKQRFAGLHFFNPVPVMKLVEVIPGPDTNEDVVDALIEFSRCLGRTPVRVKDTPGFLVNFGGRAYATEALSILNENVAQPNQVDAIMKDGFGFPMGPFELMDLTGIDVNFPVTRFIHESSFGDPRLRSTNQHRYMLETGQLGRKSGRGFYDYSNPNRCRPADYAQPSPVPLSVWVHGDNNELREIVSAGGSALLEKDDGKSPVIAAPVGEDATEYAAIHAIDPRRLVCVDMVMETQTRVTVMCAPGVDLEIQKSAAALFARTRKVSIIKDSPGFVGQRIAAMVANIGCEMAQTGLASPNDIDMAMQLGLNYPKGPLELTDSLGPATVYKILSSIQRLTGDDRYRPSQWLRRRASLGLSASHL